MKAKVHSVTLILSKKQLDSIISAYDYKPFQSADDVMLLVNLNLLRKEFFGNGCK